MISLREKLLFLWINARDSIRRQWSAINDWSRRMADFVPGEYASYRKAWQDGAAYERARSAEVALEVSARVDQHMPAKMVGYVIAQAINADRHLRDLFKEIDEGAL